MSDLDIDLNATADISRQSVRINAGNGSPLELAYTMLYLLAVAGNVAVSVGVVATSVAYYGLNLVAWASVGLGAVIGLGVGAIAAVGLLAAIRGLLAALGGNNQPRDDNGRYVPVYKGGVLEGWIKPKTAGKRNK